MARKPKNPHPKVQVPRRSWKCGVASARRSRSAATTASTTPPVPRKSSDDRRTKVGGKGASFLRRGRYPAQPLDQVLLGEIRDGERRISSGSEGVGGGRADRGTTARLLQSQAQTFLASLRQALRGSFIRERRRGYAPVVLVEFDAPTGSKNRAQIRSADIL